MQWWKSSARDSGVRLVPLFYYRGRPGACLIIGIQTCGENWRAGYQMAGGERVLTIFPTSNNLDRDAAVRVAHAFSQAFSISDKENGLEPLSNFTLEEALAQAALR